MNESTREGFMLAISLPTLTISYLRHTREEEDRKIKRKKKTNRKSDLLSSKFKLLADLPPSKTNNIWSVFFKVELILNIDSPAISRPNILTL